MNFCKTKTCKHFLGNEMIFYILHYCHNSMNSNFIVVILRIHILLSQYNKFRFNIILEKLK